MRLFLDITNKFQALYIWRWQSRWRDTLQSAIHSLRSNIFSCFSFKPCFVKPLLRNKNEKHICFEATWWGSFALEYKFLIKLILPPCLEPPPPPQTYHLQNSISYFSTHIFSGFFVYFLLFCDEYRVIKRDCQVSFFFIERECIEFIHCQCTPAVW